MNTVVHHIGLIGYGNVGSHLGQIFSDSADLKLSIYNRSSLSASEIPENASYTQDLKDLSEVDLIIIAVKDDAIISILDQIEDVILPETIVCHCSGSIPSTVISPYFKNYGVLYPLQTFSKGKDLDYASIPVFITGSDPEVTAEIERIAKNISSKIRQIGDDQRISLHIAAIFCSNYANALYGISEKICSDHDMDFSYLLPLIEETAGKVRLLSPREAQTGPAVRGDWEIIHKHEGYLSGYNAQINTIYRNLADYINKNI